MKTDVIPGGKAAGKSPSEFDQGALAKGMKVEKEHTASKAMAREIAMDHLTEFPNYYTELAKMEAKLDKSAAVLDLLLNPRRIV